MDSKLFKEKYSHLNTYDKYLDYIIELHKASIYHKNTYFFESLNIWSDNIQKYLVETSKRVKNIKALKENLKDLASAPIFLTKEFESEFIKLQNLSISINDMTVHLNDLRKDAENRVDDLNSEKDNLVEILNSQIQDFSYDKKYKYLNYKIVRQVTEKGLNIKAIAGVDQMRQVYDHVMNGLIGCKYSKLDEYKQYKKEQQEKLTKSANNKTTTKVEPQSITESKER